MSRRAEPVPHYRIVDGRRLRYADSATSGGPTILLTSPWPESLLAFRRIWARLSADAHVVAIDLPGFGHSDADTALYTPETMGAFLGRLIEQWFAGPVHLVAPDVGTGAALFLAARQPQLVRSLVVGGGAVAWPIVAGGALLDIINAPGVENLRSLDARATVGAAVEAAAGHQDEPDVHEDYVSAYDLGRFAESARYVRSYPSQNQTLGALLPTIDVPTLVVSGERDPLVPPENSLYLQRRIANSELHLLDAGHFAWEQAPRAYGELVAGWVATHPMVNVRTPGGTS